MTGKPSNTDDIVVSIIGEIGGEEAVKVASALSNEEETTDEKIAGCTGMRLNAVRKVLYRLHENHLASYRRTRDSNTGWFVYFWKLNPEKIADLISDRKRLVLRKLRERLSYEKEHIFFHCGNEQCQRCTFDEAVELSFQCPTCKSPLQFHGNNGIVGVLEDKVRKLEVDTNA
ncbi:MAG: transcription factor E [Candidatus Atabeyarchaeum deiterrae]|jgi:transcription initiation factor TFIIE subunit alpha